MSATCPRCAKALEEQQLGEMSFRCCRDCKGMLLRHADLSDVLEKSWHTISREEAETMTLQVADGWQNEPKLSCPDCHQTMEKYGYMGIAAIQIDRCDSCSLVWLDADELQNMVLALARSNYRAEADWQKSSRDRVDIVEMGIQDSAQLGRTHTWMFSGRNQNLVLAGRLLRALLG